MVDDYKVREFTAKDIMTIARYFQENGTTQEDFIKGIGIKADLIELCFINGIEGVGSKEEFEQIKGLGWQEFNIIAGKVIEAFFKVQTELEEHKKK